MSQSNTTPLDLEEVRQALQFVSANTTRDAWVKMGMAIKSEFPGDDGRYLFHDWSKTSPNQYSEASTNNAWRSFKVGSVGIGSLLKAAKEGGYKRDAGRLTRDAISSPRVAAPVLQPSNASPEDGDVSPANKAAEDAAALLSRAMAGAPSAYLARKGVRAYGTSTTASGVLLVPMVNADGEIRNVQRIFPQRYEDTGTDKFYLKGGEKVGLSHTLGQITTETSAVLFAEGYATAASLHEATGYPVVVAFDSGNLPIVARQFRSKHPQTPFVICGDDDRGRAENAGRKKATQAATENAAHLAFPTDVAVAGDLKGKDFNDLVVETGDYIAVRMAIESALQRPVLPQTESSAPLTQPTASPAADSIQAAPVSEPESAREVPQISIAASDDVQSPVNSAVNKISKPTPTEAEAATAAQKLWSQGVSARSPILTAHGIDDYGTSSLKSGVLLVPMRDSEGVVQNVQRLMPTLNDDGASRAYYVKGGKKAGLVHHIGDPSDTGVVVVTKNFLDAAAIRKATGHAAVVQFDQDYAAAIKNLRSANPSTKVFLTVPDDRQKSGNEYAKAKELAQTLGVEVALATELAPKEFKGNTFEQLNLEGAQYVRDAFDVVTRRVPRAESDEVIQPDMGAEAAQAQAASSSTHEEGRIDRTADSPVEDPSFDQLEDVLTRLRDRYDHAGNTFYFKGQDKQQAFKDAGKALFTAHAEADIARSMIELASAKGWKLIRISGSEEFCRKAWLEAEILGIRNMGYVPDAYDLEQLKERRLLQSQDATTSPANAVSEVPQPVRDSTVVGQAAGPQTPQNAVPRPELAVAQKPTDIAAPPSSEPKPVITLFQKVSQGVMANVQAHLAEHSIPQTEIDAAKAYLSNFVRSPRSFFGKLVDHGAAPYEFKADKKLSYFARIETPAGQQKVIWGVDLKRALTGKEAPLIGETVVIAYQGYKTVETKNEKGEWVSATRNEWFAKNLAKIHYHGNDHAVIASASTLKSKDQGDDQLRSATSPTHQVQGDQRLQVLERALQLKGTPPGAIAKALAVAAQQSKPIQQSAPSFGRGRAPTM